MFGCIALSACGDPLANIERLADVPVADDQAIALALPDPEETADQPGVLERWFGRSAPETNNSEPAAVIDEPTDSIVTAVSSTDATEKPRGKKRRLLSDQAFSPGTDAADVASGTSLPFGDVARVCDARGQRLGKEIARFPERGKGYRLYDSAPGATTPHTFYVTGFRDGCPRQFTAALAIFGAPSMYEQLRYGGAAENHSRSATDKAYEKVKSRVCGVAKRKPCGRKIKSLERGTVFISVYERFEDNARWADILVHDGTVLAANIKKN
ncbi:MAG: hypothetical protein ABJR23_11165 [Paracoccaceae bacterium]